MTTNLFAVLLWCAAALSGLLAAPSWPAVTYDKENVTAAAPFGVRHINGMHKHGFRFKLQEVQRSKYQQCRKCCEHCVEMCARTTGEYKEKLRGSKKEEEPQRHLLDAVFNLQPRIVLRRAERHRSQAGRTAAQANRSADDPVNMGLHFIHEHLGSEGTYARILFVDFSLPVDLQLPDGQDTAGEVGALHLIHVHYQHRGTPRMCPLPSPLLALHERLHLEAPNCQTPEVRR
ncbi:uncharacterized protein LOC133493799 isoform X5 [Syngnathoides biaculeatus]|uniref:uncharacterized protein LOC133493799 isoform X5 n=1 Tax=Syngnathoides biaculeatus TaxID=300417 RepID=UPI002ADE1DC7|nr:uncharacterized protein LOC133493799 isoform X5 [Syngnathoides biaculeatus]